ncbi:MAG: methyl-accepting chemotaxis protein [Coriobacteriia bacterium]
MATPVRRLTLSQRLMLGFLMVTIIPALGGGLAGYIAFGRSVERQGLRSVETRMDFAHDMMDRRFDEQSQNLAAAAKDARVLAGVADRDVAALSIALANLPSGGNAARYYVALDAAGQPIAASSGAPGPARADDTLVKQALDGKPVAGFELVPAQDLEALGLAEETAIEVKETPKGTVIHPQLDSALSLVVMAPVKNSSARVIGVIVCVDPLARSSAVVQEIAGNAETKATIFQHEVRISTTVTDAQGQKAYGTVVSDPVRLSTLDRGENFRGQAVVVGEQMYTAYDAIESPSGERIGMLFVGVPLRPLLQDRREFLWLLAGALIASLVIAGIWATVISRRLSAPMTALTDAAIQIAGGDLSVRAPHGGSRETRDLADAFNVMTGALASIISRAKDTSGTLASASDDITAAVRTQAEGAAKQASAVNETTATLEEMAATYRSVAEAAGRVLQLAEDALEAAEDGHSNLNATVEGVVMVRQESERTKEAADQLSESASDIGQIIMMIDSIAAQTKILALNAAIEAARAGDAGKGFAVVATEIRALAESVTDSTSHIERLLDTIRQGSESLTRAAGRQDDQVSEAVERGGRTEASFSEIVEKMAVTASAAREIAASAQQQKTASEQVVQAMHQVATSAQETAAAATQAEGAVDGLVDRSNELDNALQGFRV